MFVKQSRIIANFVKMHGIFRLKCNIGGGALSDYEAINLVCNDINHRYLT